MESSHGDWAATPRLLPHQVGLVAEARAAARPARVLLTGPVGYGTGHGLAAAARAACGESAAGRRVLVLARGSLTVQWAERLTGQGFASATVLDGPAFRRIEATTSADQNPWREHDCVVVSASFLQRDPARQESALTSGWDVVVIDELHLYADHSPGEQLARRIWTDRSIPCVLATSAIPGKPEWAHVDPATRHVRWDTSTLLASGAVQKHPVRRINLHHYDLTPAEEGLASQLSLLLDQLPATPGGRATRDALLRRSYSSPLSLEMLVRALLRAEGQVHGPSGILTRYESLLEWTYSIDDIPDGDESMSLLDGSTSRAALEACHGVLDSIEWMPADSKWLACETVLDVLGARRDDMVVILTDYDETAGYIASRMEDSRECVLLSGSASSCAPSDLEHTVREWGGQLVCTVGAAAGLDLSFADQVLHYDTPWRPDAMELRLGLTDPFVSDDRSAVHHILLPAGQAGAAVVELLGQVRQIETAFGIASDTNE